MTIVEIRENKDARTLQERAANEVYVPASNDHSSAKQILVRKVQHLDVDGVLARSLPKTGALSPRDVKTIVLR
jgi:hypothetical protein